MIWYLNNLTPVPEILKIEYYLWFTLQSNLSSVFLETFLSIDTKSESKLHTI